MRAIARGALNLYSNLPAASRVGFAILILLAAIAGDYFTGPQISVSFFYLIPVLMLTWSSGPLVGLMAATAAAVAERFFLAAPGLAVTVLIWNTLVRLGSFAAVIAIVEVLKERLGQEEAAARQDALTGLLNTRGFHERAEVELLRQQRYGGGMTIAYLDCDNFKAINDKLGHSVGDQLLRLVGETIQLSIRSTDVGGRIGGDEFAVLLVQTGKDAAADVLEKMRGRLANAMKTNEWPVTFSIGCIHFTSAPESVDALIRAADDVMYGVKKRGKDRLELTVS